MLLQVSTLFYKLKLFKDFMEDYNPKWGEYCRTICLSILLLGDGMHLELKGKVIQFYFKYFRA